MQASYEDQAAAVPLPADWLTFVAEVRSSIEDLSQLLERMRSAVDRLALASSASDGVSPAEGEPPAWPEIDEFEQDEPGPAEDLIEPESIREQVRLEEERARAEIASGRVDVEDAPAACEEPGEESPALVVDAPASEAASELDPEAVREQVRLEVERARAEIAAGRTGLGDAVEADGEPAESLGQPSSLAARLREPQYEQRAAIGAPMMV